MSQQTFKLKIQIQFFWLWNQLQRCVNWYRGVNLNSKKYWIWAFTEGLAFAATGTTVEQCWVRCTLWNTPLLQQGSCFVIYSVGLSSHFTKEKILFQNYWGQPLTQQLNYGECSVWFQPFGAEQNAWGKKYLIFPWQRHTDFFPGCSWYFSPEQYGVRLYPAKPGVLRSNHFLIHSHNINTAYPPTSGLCHGKFWQA